MPVKDDFRLLEVATGIYREVSDLSVESSIPRLKGREGGKRTFVNEDETQVVPGGVFLVDFAERGSEVETA